MEKQTEKMRERLAARLFFYCTVLQDEAKCKGLEDEEIKRIEETEARALSELVDVDSREQLEAWETTPALQLMAELCGRGARRAG